PELLEADPEPVNDLVPCFPRDKDANTVDLWLLRRRRRAKGKEHCAKCKANSSSSHESLLRFLLLTVSPLTAHGHLITRSALASTLGGIVRPICFAVFRLITNSNFIGCSTGRSAGLAPFRILSTYVAARRYKSAKLGA